MTLHLFLILILAITITKSQFDYDNFQSWPESCQTGTHQSPINIPTSDVKQCDEEGFAIQVFDGQSLLNPKGQAQKSDSSAFHLTVINQTQNVASYSSLQFHFHHTSQHSINGQRTDLQMHIVNHIDPFYQNDHVFVVVAILFKENSSVTHDIFDDANFFGEMGIANYGNLFNIFNPIFINGSFYHYNGSLTTPNCGQVVSWWILTQILPIKPSNLAKIVLKINNGNLNARPLQPINDRKIILLDNNCRAKNNVRIITNLRAYQKFTFFSVISIIALITLS